MVGSRQIEGEPNGSMKARTQPNLTFALLRALAENWWLLLIRGILAIAFGVLVLLWPDLTLLTLTFLWGAYAIADGIFALGAATAAHRPRRHDRVDACVFNWNSLGGTFNQLNRYRALSSDLASHL